MIDNSDDGNAPSALDKTYLLLRHTVSSDRSKLALAAQITPIGATTRRALSPFSSSDFPTS